MTLPHTLNAGALAITVVVTLTACADDPQYLKRDQVLEAGPDIDPALATDQIVLPIRLETENEAMDRMALQDELTMLGGMPVEVPLISLGDISLSVEWTLKNLSQEDGTARVHVNASNGRYTYVPESFVVNGDVDELPPSLVGGVPISVPAEALQSNVFREDELREAAVDLDIIATDALNPFAAILQPHDDLDELVVDGGLLALPEAIRDRAEEIIPHVVQLNIRLEASTHMALEYTVRVRDHADMLHDMLLDAPAEELQPFAAAQLAPAAHKR